MYFGGQVYNASETTRVSLLDVSRSIYLILNLAYIKTSQKYFRHIQYSKVWKTFVWEDFEWHREWPANHNYRPLHIINHIDQVNLD